MSDPQPPGEAQIPPVDDVLASINFGCVQAFSSDEEDTVSVLQAIRGQY